MNMDFAANKIPVEVFKEGPFAGTYFRDITLVLIVNVTETRGKNLMS